MSDRRYARKGKRQKRKEGAIKKISGEFRAFISKGNVLDLAVGVIIGSMFTAIVNSLVQDLFMPVVGLFTGGLDFTSLRIVLGSGENAATLNYGAFISAIINFLLTAIIIFFFVKGINKINDMNVIKLGIGDKDDKDGKPKKKECPYCRTQIHRKAVRCPNCTSELETEEVQVEDTTTSV